MPLKLPLLPVVAGLGFPVMRTLNAGFTLKQQSTSGKIVALALRSLGWPLWKYTFRYNVLRSYAVQTVAEALLDHQSLSGSELLEVIYAAGKRHLERIRDEAKERTVTGHGCIDCLYW